MKLYSENDSYKLYNGDMLDMLQVIEPESIDAIVCDPPYELGFMNKSWDSTGIAFKKETWENCLKVLKPGGYLLAFGGSRTYHRIACAIEDAGFEIRDCVMYLYGTGFPKSMDIAKALEGKLTLGSSNPKDFKKLNGEQITRGNWGYATMQLEQGYRNKNYDIEAESKTYLGKLEPTTDLAKEWQGWGTCLKPAYEPIIVARKPFKGSVVDNIIKYRVGGLNIDECRILTNDNLARINKTDNGMFGIGIGNNNAQKCKELGIEYGGRFPSNVITDGSEEVAKGKPNTTSNYDENNRQETEIHRRNNDILTYGYKQRVAGGFNDSGSAMRYFYSAKTSKKDRDEGLDNLKDGLLRRVRPDKDDDKPTGLNKDPRFAPVVRKNIHPTCKPTELMQYLVRLVSPKGATILDPFMGSGSTGKAVMFENRERDANYKFIGIELTDEYLPIAQARIEYARDKFKYDLEQEKVTKGKQNIFDFMESEE